MKTSAAMSFAFAVVAMFATPAMAVKDDFNRTPLGKRWVVPFGRLYILYDELMGDNESLGYYTKSEADFSVRVTAVLNSTDVEYAAVAIGDVASGNNIFVKIQEQDQTEKFEYAGFYGGNNQPYTFFPLDTPASSPAIMTVSMCGTVATLQIKSVEGTQKYSFDYGTNFGPGGGLGVYGAIALDNYQSGRARCEESAGAKMVRRSNANDLSLPISNRAELGIKR